MSDVPLFSEVAVEVPPRSHPCKYPYFIVAYWPSGDYWKIHEPLAYSDLNSVNLKGMVSELQKRGWQFVTICRLPKEGPWA